MALVAMVRALIEREPRTLGDLESIVGSVGKVMWMGASMPIVLPSMSGARVDWPPEVVRFDLALGLEDRQVDFYHQDPYVPLGPDFSFEGYRAYVAGGADAAESLPCGPRFLLERFGEGRFSLGWHRDGSAAIGACRLAPPPSDFCPAPPGVPSGGPPGGFAYAPPPPAIAPLRTHSNSARAAFLERLVKGLQQLTTPEDGERFFAVIPPDAGLEALRGSTSRPGKAGWTTLHGLAFNPPEDARAIATLLGLRRPAAFTVDVHMSSYRMAEAEQASYGPYLVPRFPTIAGFSLDVTVDIDHRAARIETRPASSACELDGATVPRLYLTPPW